MIQAGYWILLPDHLSPKGKAALGHLLFGIGIRHLNAEIISVQGGRCLLALEENVSLRGAYAPAAKQGPYAARVCFSIEIDDLQESARNRLD